MYWSRFLFLIFMLWVGWLLQATSVRAEGSLYVLDLDAEVTVGLASFIDRTVVEARAAGAEGIVLRLDTYGGRVDAAIDIADALSRAKPIPVYTFVTDKAWSAGALISLATETIVMQEGASIGSATPIVQTGGGVEPVEEKYVSALRAKFRALAEQHGYAPALAEAMVDRTLEVKEVAIGGERMFLSQKALAERSATASLPLKVIRTVVKEGELLNLTAQEAVRVGIAKQVVPDEAAFFAAIGHAEGSRVVRTQNSLERLANVLTHPVLTSMLLTLGVILLYLEFQSPGLGWVGGMGAFCFAIFFGGRYVVNLADWGELLLFLGGIAFLLVEIFLLPGFGIAGVMGVVCLLASLYLALVPFVVPRAPWEVAVTQEALVTLLGSLVVAIVGFFLLMRYLDRLPGLRGLLLTAQVGGGARRRWGGLSLSSREEGTLQRSVPDVQREFHVGMMGRTVTELRPVGRVDFSGKLVDAISQEGVLPPDAVVTVKRIEGAQVYVGRG